MHHLNYKFEVRQEQPCIYCRIFDENILKIVWSRHGFLFIADVMPWTVNQFFCHVTNQKPEKECNESWYDVNTKCSIYQKVAILFPYFIDYELDLTSNSMDTLIYE